MSDKDSGDSPGTQRQMEIYKWGLIGFTPRQSVSIEDLAREAKSVLKPEAYDYLAGGAGSEDTMRSNLEAFRRWRIVPRQLRGVARRELGVDMLGQRLPAPFTLAPIGVLSILHKEAEIAVARAARSLGIPLILSSVSSRTIEEVADEMGDVTRWFQLYWPRNDELAASFLRRAEKAGYKAVVVTLDTFELSWRERDIQNAYLPFVHGDGPANYFSDPVFHEAIGGDPRLHPIRAREYFGETFSVRLF
jgi:isopentenyl diphosphate isomerase/L-lactate dehydrogenase-like FMN-dependent dehydrogenase